MAEIDPVILQLRADLDQYLVGLRHSTRTVDQQLGLQERRAAAFERHMSGLSSRVGAALGGIVTLATAREMLRLVDAGKQVEAQLRLATRESGSFGQAQEDVRRIAAETRTGLEETASLYSVFQRDSVALGISQLDAARATETLAKSFLISGANAVETAQSTRQLIQGLQSGTLRGDEFNSVMEAAPRLQKLFAASLGVSKGELRAMAEEGKITAAAIIDALTNEDFTKGIDAEFREMPVTFDQAMQQIKNAAIITFSAFDRGGAFSQMLTNFVMGGTAGFAELEDAAVDAGIEIRSAFAGLQDAFQPLLDGARFVFGEIGGEARSLTDQISATLGEIDSMRNWLSPPGGIDAIIDEKLWGIPQAPSDLRGRFDRGQAASERLRRDEIAVQRMLDTPALRHYDMLGNRIAPTGGGGGGGAAAKPSRPRGPSAETLAARAERERIAGIREEGRKQEDLLGLQDDIIAARAALATAAEDVARFELQQLSLEQAARLSQYNTELRIGDLTKQEYDERARALSEEMALRRQAVEVDRDKTAFEQERERRRESLRMQQDQAALESDALLAQADIADTLEKRRFLEESALALQQEIERALLEQAVQEGKVADAAAARAALATRQAAEMRSLERANQGPLGQYAQSLSDPRTRVEEAVVRKLEDIDNGIADAIAEQTGIHDPLIRDLISIFIEDTLIRPIVESMQKARSSGGGFLGGLLGAVQGILGVGGGVAKSAGMGGTGALKGFAGGGSGMIGGRPGIDNNVLSLNGQPFARVSRGERMDIVPNAQLARPGRQAAGLVRIMIEEDTGFASRVRTEAAGVAIEVVKVAQPELTQAAVNETFRQAGRPTL